MFYTILHHSDELAGVDMADGIAGQTPLHRAPLAVDCQPGPREVSILEAVPPPAFGQVGFVDREDVQEEPGRQVGPSAALFVID